MADIWQASAARDHFSEMVDAAVAGRPQFVRRRDGQQVVVALAYYEATRPSLKDLLLFGGFVPNDETILDEHYEAARRLLGTSLQIDPMLRA